MLRSAEKRSIFTYKEGQLSVKTIGIDAGGSLIKVAFEEQGCFHFKKYPISKVDEIAEWLALIVQNRSVRLTGGKAEYLRKNYFPNGKVVPEFDAACEGAVFLMKKTRMNVPKKLLLVNIGTGTSWYLIEDSNHKRVLGSGIGGGTFLGLGSLLAGKDDYSQLVSLAKEGKRAKIDLLVKDLYYPDLPPIEGELTASNFAKVKQTNSSVADTIAALINMMTETIILLSMQTAEIHQVTDILFIGSTLIENSLFQEGLRSFTMSVGLNPIFLLNGEYSGAVGALILS
nr:type II pantothenate kinase [Mesobacillus maritimus]